MKPSKMTSEHTPPSNAMHKIARACTDPLWLQHPLLATGHDITTENGTATFIKFDGRHYLCTCRHVVETANGGNVPALMIDQNVINLSNFQTDQSGKVVNQHVFRFPDPSRFDIALTSIDSVWNILHT